MRHKIFSTILHLTIFLAATFGFRFTLLAAGLNKSDDSPLTQLLQAALEVPKDTALVHGHWGMVAVFADQGDPFININGEKSMAPASCLKLLTTSAALCLLGEEHQFQTQLAYSGAIDNAGTLHGDVVIIGGGDPTLGSDRIDGVMNYDELIDIWADTIRGLGIEAIDGYIIGDDRHFDNIILPDHWFWEDMGNYYGAGPSGLCFHENYYRITFKPGKVGQKAAVIKINPPIPGMSFVNQMKTGPAGSGDKGSIFGAPHQWLRILRGSVPAGYKQFSIKGSMPDPAKVCALSLLEGLKRNGIEVTRRAITAFDMIFQNRIQSKLKIFYTQNSPALREIVYWLNKRSINIYAEQLLKQLARTATGEGSYEQGFKVLREFLADRQIPLEGLHLHDGCGLSRLNTMTPLQLTLLLREMTREVCFQSFYDSLPITGDAEDAGWIGHLCRGTRAARNLRAKTGSIMRVRAHAGYVKTRSNQLVCFSMIANEFTSSTQHIDKLHEKIMILLAELP